MNVREWALPVYTILMQVAVGSMLGLWLIRTVAIQQYGRFVTDRIIRIPILAVLLTVTAAIIGSHFHLSHPVFSLLATLNLRSSWLSREVLFTISFFTTIGSLSYLHWFTAGYPHLKTGLGWLAIALGLLSVYSMSKIYLLPTHSSWNSPLTVISFILTAVILGATAVAVLLLMDLKVWEEVAEQTETAVREQLIRQSFVWLAGGALVTAVINLILNLILILHLSQGDLSAQISFSLLLGLYQPLFGLRYIALFTGVGWFSLTALILFRNAKTQHEIITPIYLSCLLVLISEILGRFLFYATHVRTGI
ncbi:MAG: dimethyl sulfoxide reductase anchor subunit [Ardenticatenaceae bacterium]|nr:dimethyl sulfoxide reductase anchor subunit [Ardenticatenaceae bacterium]